MFLDEYTNLLDLIIFQRDLWFLSVTNPNIAGVCSPQAVVFLYARPDKKLIRRSMPVIIRRLYLGLVLIAVAFLVFFIFSALSVSQFQ